MNPVDRDTEVTVLNRVTDPAVAEAVWRTYEEAFQDAAAVCAQEQRCYDRRGFLEALASGEHTIFLGYMHGRLKGFALATANLELARVAYANPVFFRRRFSEFTSGPAPRLYYVTALAVAPDARGMRVGFELAASMTRWMAARRACVAYDFSSNKNRGLPELIEAAARTADSDPQWEVLDTQQFVVHYPSASGRPR